MARFFAALLAAAAMFSVGSAAPYTFPNGTAPGVPSPTNTSAPGVFNVPLWNTTSVKSKPSLPVFKHDAILARWRLYTMDNDYE
ncbi:hypothetical protein F4775DRAFT_597196 [Biscogniauxia sp. FL1348]|nr:hypothetical protein F4775DRAFT_597196 [Biscogniauxia sp. FL1348]